MNSRLVIAGTAAAVVVAGTVIWTATRPPAPTTEPSEPATARQSIETPAEEDVASDAPVADPTTETSASETGEPPTADLSDQGEAETAAADQVSGEDADGQAPATQDGAAQEAEPSEAAEPVDLTGREGPAVATEPASPSSATQAAGDPGPAPQPETAGDEEETAAEASATATGPAADAVSPDGADDVAGDITKDSEAGRPEDLEAQREATPDASEASAEQTDGAATTETVDLPETPQEQDASREPVERAAEPPGASESDEDTSASGLADVGQAGPSQESETADRPGEAVPDVAAEDSETIDAGPAPEAEQAAAPMEADSAGSDVGRTEREDEGVAESAEAVTDTEPQPETPQETADRAAPTTNGAASEDVVADDGRSIPAAEPAVDATAETGETADRRSAREVAEADGTGADDPASERADAESDGSPDGATAPQDDRPQAAEQTVVADAGQSAEQRRDDGPATTESADETEVAALPSIRPPSFDAVRVGESRMAVIAGTAPAGATVLIRSGDRVLGRVQADGRGDWVWLSDGPLEPGSYQLELAAELPDRKTPILSDRVVVMVVPEPRRTIAGTEAEGDTGESLILMAPRDEVGATTALQVPEAPRGEGLGEAVGDSGAVESGDAAASEEATQTAAADEEAATEGATAEPQPAAGSAAPTRPATASITVVDYGEDGRLIVSGEGVPGASVRLYLSGEAIGEGRILTDGSWTVTADDAVDPGTYRLRADVLADDGQVLARAETPFRRDVPAEPAPPGRTEVVVQPGNSLWRIARSVYGQGVQYTVIYQANIQQIRDPDLIYPGQVFTLPAPPNALPEGLPEGAPG